MKFKKIVGFGDSWMWGDELLDPALVDHEYAHPILMENIPYRESHCFLGLLGKHYGVPVENFGIPGGSQQSAIWTYLWWLEHEQLDPAECLIIVGHTDASRYTFYNPNHKSYGNDPEWNRFVHSAWVHNGSGNISKEWVDMVKMHTVLTSCKQSATLTYQQSVLFFEGQHNTLSKNVLQFCSLNPPTVMNASNLIWPDRSISLFVNNDRSLLAPNRHPNELGHETIKNHLIPEIERVILA